MVGRVRPLLAQPWRDAVRFHRAGAWTDATLPGMIADHADRSPDHLAIIEDGGRRITYLELAAAAERAATELARRAIDQGDAVVIMLRDSAAFLAATAAAHAVGCVTVPVRSGAGEREVAAIIERTGARAYAGAAQEWPCLSGMARIEIGFDGEDRHANAGALGIRVVDPDALSEIMFTSGTTGTPKGVMNSANTKLAGLRAFLEELAPHADDIWGALAPLAHNAGWLYSVLPAVATGTTAVIIRRGDPERMLDALSREAVTVAFMIPTHASDLTRRWREAPERWPLRLRHVITGAAACPPGVIDAIRDDWGAELISMYGMTECQGNLFTRPGDPPDVARETVGRPSANAEVVLRSPADGGLLQGDGAVGEVVTRGAQVFLGYYGDQPATAAAFTKDGWFRSGDLGMMVAGNIRIVGRIKEVILRGGQTIVPSDLEAAIEHAPGVEQVAVVGLPDERLGESVCACVVGRADLAGVTEYLAGAGIGRGLWPDSVVEVPSLPRTELGKVKRHELVTLAVCQLQDPARHGEGAVRA